MKKKFTAQPKISIEKFAENSLWFLYGDGHGIHSCAARALAEEVGLASGVHIDDWYTAAQDLIGFPGSDVLDDDGLFIVEAPKELHVEEIPFTNSMNEEDSYEDIQERIITGWYPQSDSLIFILKIDPKAPRDKVFKDLRDWFWKLSKQHPASKRHRLVSPEAVLLHLAIVRLDRAKFTLDQIAALLSQIPFLEKADINKSDIRDSRKYIKRLIRKIDNAASYPLAINYNDLH